MFIPIGDNVKIKRFPIIIFILIVLNLIFYFKFRVNADLLFSPYEIKNPKTYTFFKIFLSMFIHGSIFHLIFNMIFLYAFGRAVEEKIGHIKLSLLYFIGGIFSLLFYVLFNIDSKIPVIGASGAISAVMGSYFVYFFRKKINTISILPPFKFQVSSWIFFIVWLVSQLINLNSPTVAVLAHLGGFFFGFIASKAFDN